MRRIPAAIAFSLCVLGCGTIREPAPSGKPVELYTFGERCQDLRVEGVLRTGGKDGGIQQTDIVVGPLDTVVWPERVNAESVVSVRWPRGFKGVAVAGGEVAVVDGAGNLVATTGGRYSLLGGWILAGSTYDHDLPPRLVGFQACSVIPL